MASYNLSYAKFDAVISAARSDGGKKFYALFSGGKDSVTVAHLLHGKGLLAGCLFIDTSICLDETKAFVAMYCYEMGWPLEIIERTDNCKSYDDFVMRYGFPSRAWHNVAMRELKWKPLYYWIMQRKDQGIVLCSGVRSKESKRRMSNTVPYQRDASCKHMRWAAPIHDWSTPQVWKYIHAHGLKRSPVYETLGMSGDCLCGAFSSHGEAELIQLHHPAMAERIRRLEASCANDRNTWGNQSSMSGVASQESLTAFTCADCENDCPTRKRLLNELGGYVHDF